MQGLRLQGRTHLIQPIINCQFSNCTINHKWRDFIIFRQLRLMVYFHWGKIEAVELIDARVIVETVLLKPFRSMPSKVTIIVIEFTFLDRKMFWAYLKANFNLRRLAQAESRLSRSQDIFIPYNLPWRYNCLQHEKDKLSLGNLNPALKCRFVLTCRVARHKPVEIKSSFYYILTRCDCLRKFHPQQTKDQWLGILS